MGSKTPPSAKPFPEEPRDDPRAARSADSLKSRMLGRIADALQVPPAALYQPPNAVTPVRGVDRSDTADLIQECTALLDVFRRIDDPEARRRVLTLALETAERT